MTDPDGLTERLRELPRYRGVCSQNGCTTGQFEGWWVSAYALDEVLAASVPAQDVMEPLKAFVQGLIAKQANLPPACARILRENYWDLLSSESAASAPAQEPQCTGPFSDAFDCPIHNPAAAPRAASPDPVEQAFAEMQMASDLIDEAYGTSDYQAQLIALALVAREFIRRRAAALARVQTDGTL